MNKTPLLPSGNSVSFRILSGASLSWRGFAAPSDCPVLHLVLVWTACSTQRRIFIILPEDCSAQSISKYMGCKEQLKLSEKNKKKKKNQDLHSSQHNPVLRSELSSWCLTFYFCIFIIEIIEAFSSVDARNNFLWLFSLMLTEEKNSPNMVYANILFIIKKDFQPSLHDLSADEFSLRFT